MFWAGALLAVFSLGIFWRGLQHSRKGAFYQDVFWLLPWGMYVWGDALILAPFWSLVGVAISLGSWLDLPVTMAALRFYLLFLTVRSAYEVVYWITHQVAQKPYTPPLFRRWQWLRPNDSAILYQLLHTCAVVVLLAVLYTVS